MQIPETTNLIRSTFPLFDITIILYDILTKKIKLFHKIS